MYDYTSANDLVKWVQEQLNKPNYYQNGGIGRYDSNNYRIFDCCGLFKCFMWHDYSQKNASKYNKTQKDFNCEQLLAEATEKGDFSIETMKGLPLGTLVYQYQHMGIYIGNGEVIESTAAKFDGKQGKIYKTQFTNPKGTNYRGTWTKWFKSPNLKYEEAKPVPSPTPQPSSNFLAPRGDFRPGDNNPNIGKIASFMYKTFPVYTDKRALGNYYGPFITASIKEFQKRTGIQQDGCIGPITLAELKKYGFRE